jgi:hypothetical protein
MSISCVASTIGSAELHTDTPTVKLSDDAEPAERALKGGKMARKKHFQRGSLFKRGKRNKVWVARYREPVIGANGETEFVRRSEILGTVADLPTRRDAEMVLSDRLRRVNSADYHPRSCCSFRSFVQEWEAQAHPTLKYATQEHYKYVVNSHLLPVFGNVQLRFISRESIQMFLAGKLKEGLSWRTVKHCRTTLGTILGTAEFWGYIEDNRRQSSTQNQTPATWPSARKDGLDARATEFLAGKAAGTVQIACLAVGLDRLTDRRIVGSTLARCRFAGWTPSCKPYALRGTF